MNIKSFKVERWLNTYENDADYEMAETDVKPFTLKELLELGNFNNLKEQLLSIKLGYNPTSGSDKLKETVASIYQHNVKPENVLITTGAIEADYHVTNSLYILLGHIHYQQIDVHSLSSQILYLNL